MYAQYLENAAQKRAAVVPRPGLSGDGSGNSTETVVPAPATVKGKNENSNKKKGQKKDGNQKKVSTKHEQKQSVQQNPNASNTRARDGDQEHGVAVVSTSGNKNGDKQNKKRKQKKQKKPSTGVAANSPSGREDARMPEMAVNDVAGTYVSWETIESGDIDRFRVPETVHPVVLAALRNSVFPPNRLAAAGYILREGQQMLKMRRGPSSTYPNLPLFPTVFAISNRK